MIAEGVLCTVALYGKGILQLPGSGLVEEFKCIKVKTEVLLAGSKGVVVSKVVPNPTKGRNGIQEWQLRRQKQLFDIQRL